MIYFWRPLKFLPIPPPPLVLPIIKILKYVPSLMSLYYSFNLNQVKTALLPLKQKGCLSQNFSSYDFSTYCNVERFRIALMLCCLRGCLL